MQEVVCNYDFMYKHYRCHIDKKTIENDKIALKGTQIVGKTNEDVKWLDFSECKILTFPTNLHEFIPNITSLRINCCNLEHFSREHIKNFKSLVYFRIENCGLKKLKSDLFKNLNNLWHISFRNNELEEIEPQILDNLPKLRFVDFRGNKNYDMWHDSSVASSNSLGEIKKDLVIKSDPLAMFFHQQEVKEPKDDQKKKMQKLEQQNQKLTAEIERMKKNEQSLLEILTILTDDAFKDFTININQTSFQIHKTLFAARSSTLADLFRNNPEVQELNLRDIPEQTFKAIHDFIYTNRLPNDVNHLETFAAASQLKIKELIKISSENLLANLKEENSFEMLVLSNKFENEKMRKKSFDVIQNKIFPERKLDPELAKHPDKLKKLIDMKKMLEMEFLNL